METNFSPVHAFSFALDNYLNAVFTHGILPIHQFSQGKQTQTYTK